MQYEVFAVVAGRNVYLGCGKASALGYLVSFAGSAPVLLRWTNGERLYSNALAVPII
jgi:hypothetical protein